MEYVSIDIETTGLKTKTDRIIEVGAVKMRDGKEVDSLSVLIDPHMVIPEEVVKLTGICNELVKGAPDISEVIGKIVEFCEGCDLVGHHLITDFAFIKRDAQRRKMTFEHFGYDTLELLRRYYPQLQSKKLGDACRALGYPETESFHRAINDARATAWLFEKIFSDVSMKNSENPEKLRRKIVHNVKKDSPLTIHQKEDLNHLLKYHKIQLTVDIDTLTKSEASRIIDRIYAEYGREGRRQRY